MSPLRVTGRFKFLSVLWQQYLERLPTFICTRNIKAVNWLTFTSLYKKMFILLFIFGSVYPLKCYDCIEIGSQTCEESDQVDCAEFCMTKQINESQKIYLRQTVWTKMTVFIDFILHNCVTDTVGFLTTTVVFQTYSVINAVPTSATTKQILICLTK